jgi:RNA polymerase sigma factor (sigma-70 family)
VEDKLHETFVIVVQAIQSGDLREPERLMGFVRTVVRRQIAGHIGQLVHCRNEECDIEMESTIPDRRRNPEQSVAFHEQVEVMKAVLGELSQRDREILTRFYFDEQTQGQICEEMKLSETQFRLLKSRAKTTFGEFGQRRVARKRLAM